MFETEALKSLGSYPLVQAAVAILILMAGVWVVFRGERDKKSSDPIPQWTMMGPMHDAIGAIHDMAEQGRKQCDLLERSEAHLQHLSETARAGQAILEMIRNESRLR
jgi:hypothetical protein